MDSEVREALLKAGCITFGNFILSSGRRSNIYIDIRRLYSFPRYLQVVVDAIVGLLERLNPGGICGVPTGGLPLSSIVAYRMALPLIFVRKREKNYGTRKLVEGTIRSGAKYVVVDDVATTGSSIARAIESIRELGGIVGDAVVVVDREEGAREFLEKMGVKLHSLLKLRELVEGG